MLDEKQHQLLEEVIQIASKNAEDIKQEAQSKLSLGQSIPSYEIAFLSTEQLVLWITILAKVVIVFSQQDDKIASAEKLWQKVRKFFIYDNPNWTVMEFIIFQLTKDERSNYFPYGLSVYDLYELSELAFSMRQIRYSLSKLEKLGLVKRCYSRRTTRITTEKDSNRKIIEQVWFYAGSGSKFSLAHEQILYMWTPIKERPKYLQLLLSMKVSKKIIK